VTEVVGVDGQSLTKNEEVKGKGKETEASTSQPEAEDEQVSRMNGETQAASLVADDNQGAGAAVFAIKHSHCPRFTVGVKCMIFEHRGL